mmetsp:Transcript_34322/g.85019  ORF Transcript_34322/g.85019 Transcript_34322/m.85019 type:complete len:318 (-) Transcript_34322:1591-2544(-)
MLHKLADLLSGECTEWVDEQGDDLLGDLLLVLDGDDEHVQDLRHQALDGGLALEVIQAVHEQLGDEMRQDGLGQVVDDGVSQLQHRSGVTRDLQELVANDLSEDEANVVSVDDLRKPVRQVDQGVDELIERQVVENGPENRQDVLRVLEHAEQLHAHRVEVVQVNRVTEHLSDSHSGIDEDVLDVVEVHVQVRGEVEHEVQELQRVQGLRQLQQVIGQNVRKDLLEVGRVEQLEVGVQQVEHLLAGQVVHQLGDQVVDQRRITQLQQTTEDVVDIVTSLVLRLGPLERSDNALNHRLSTQLLAHLAEHLLDVVRSDR